MNQRTIDLLVKIAIEIVVRFIDMVSIHLLPNCTFGKEKRLLNHYKIIFPFQSLFTQSCEVGKGKMILREGQSK